MIAAIDSKPYFQRLFRPTANLMARAGVTANQVTVTSIALSAAAGAAAAASPAPGWP